MYIYVVYEAREHTLRYPDANSRGRSWVTRDLTKDNPSISSTDAD